MLNDAVAFNQPIGNWNVSNVTNMESIFENALTFNQPIGNWNVSNVTNTDNMFHNAQSFNQPIGSWNVSNVTNMCMMFESAELFNQPIGGWNVSRVDNMRGMFCNASWFNQPVGNWNVSSVADMRSMFKNAESFNQPIDNWNVSNVTNMLSMFANAASFNRPIDHWNVSNVEYMERMFEHAVSFNQPIDTWDISRVENMGSMFFEAESFSQPLARWNLSNDNMQIMFRADLNAYLARVPSNVRVAQTTEEYMSMCLTADRTADECMRNTCPICHNEFIRRGDLVRPVMFHKTVIRGKEIWSCPMHGDEQLQWANGHRDECAMCRQKVFIHALQKEDIMREAAATKIQSMARGHMSRKKPKSGGKKRSNRRKHVKHNKMTRKGSRMHKKMH